MNVLSVAARQAGNGVSNYTASLEREMVASGVEVASRSYLGALKTLFSQTFDRVVIQHELLTSLRSPDLAVLFVILIAAKIKRVPVTVVEHTVLHRAYLQAVSPRATEPFLILQHAAFAIVSRFSRLVVLTESSRDWLRTNGIAAGFVPIGVFDTSEVAAAPTASENVWKPLERRTIVGLVGHQYAFKRFELGIRTFGRMSSRARSNALLLVVGGSAQPVSGTKAIQKELATLDPSQYLVTGPLDDAAFRSATARCDVVLLPYADSLTASAIVSWLVAYAVPTVVSTSTQFDRLVEIGGAVRVADWDVEAAHVLEDLLSDGHRRATMKDRIAAYSPTESLRNTVERLLNP